METPKKKPFEMDSSTDEQIVAKLSAYLRQASELMTQRLRGVLVHVVAAAARGVDPPTI